MWGKYLLGVVREDGRGKPNFAPHHPIKRAKIFETFVTDKKVPILKKRNSQKNLKTKPGPLGSIFLKKNLEGLPVYWVIKQWGRGFAGKKGGFW